MSMRLIKAEINPPTDTDMILAATRSEMQHLVDDAKVQSLCSTFGWRLKHAAIRPEVWRCQPPQNRTSIFNKLSRRAYKRLLTEKVSILTVPTAKISLIVTHVGSVTDESG